MKQPAQNKEREERIDYEIVVDCHGEEERAMGWYYYAEDSMTFPFTARCVVKRASSPLKIGETVEVKTTRTSSHGDWPGLEVRAEPVALWEGVGREHQPLPSEMAECRGLAPHARRRALVGAEARQARPVDIPPELPGPRIDTTSVSR